MKIGLISDTHGYLDPLAIQYCQDCDEIWHAGDFGSLEIGKQLEEVKPLRGVFGNVDGTDIRDEFPENLRFRCEEMDVWITHIGGYPGRYDRRVRDEIRSNPPDLFICGHSHVLKVKKDKRLDLLHLNPGAAGNQGFHMIRTMMLFEINGKEVQKLNALDMGPRGTPTKAKMR